MNTPFLRKHTEKLGPKYCYYTFSDCQYGDKFSGCSSLSKSGCYSGNNEAGCCEWCAQYDTGIAGMLVLVATEIFSLDISDHWIL